MAKFSFPNAPQLKGVLVDFPQAVPSCAMRVCFQLEPVMTDALTCTPQNVSLVKFLHVMIIVKYILSTVMKGEFEFYPEGFLFIISYTCFYLKGLNVLQALGVMSSL